MGWGPPRPPGTFLSFLLIRPDPFKFTSQDFLKGLKFWVFYQKRLFAALFTFFTIGAFIWLIYTLLKLYKNRQSANLEKIVEQIKLKETDLINNT